MCLVVRKTVAGWQEFYTLKELADVAMDDDVNAELEAKGHRLTVVGEGFVQSGFASFASPIAIVRGGPKEFRAGVDTFHSAYAAGI